MDNTEAHAYTNVQACTYTHQHGCTKHACPPAKPCSYRLEELPKTKISTSVNELQDLYSPGQCRAGHAIIAMITSPYSTWLDSTKG